MLDRKVGSAIAGGGLEQMNLKKASHSSYGNFSASPSPDNISKSS